MPYSHLNNDLEFNENEWIVSLINTQSGISGLFGGHAKIVVEGVVRKTNQWFATEIFVGEYHIMEAERIHENTWIPQCLRNTKCKYVVLFSERNNYTARQEQQYSQVYSRSCGGMKPEVVRKMIQNIKQEQQDINADIKNSNFQYAGEWCFYSYEGGHNCTTWAEEKLNIIGLGKYLLTDSSKASPFLHVTSGNGCLLI